MWAENQAAFFLFVQLQTQWYVGAVGRTGLNHLVLLARIDRMKFSEEDSGQMFSDVLEMELAALEEMNKGED